MAPLTRSNPKSRSTPLLLGEEGLIAKTQKSRVRTANVDNEPDGDEPIKGGKYAGCPALSPNQLIILPV
ncbi:hypothetical protein [Prochlorococcus sp. MIT 1341]|uniref:hypothetical protein n=1 Tax=Prochlorococcus sp. MIT 1341 TaxID=3096221 RepID=UPI002A766C06|nr:hypothetical protein [Prochlorococcus sp. MIT 1341]